MNKLLAAMLACGIGIGPLVFAETFDDALAAFNDANASKGAENPGYAKAFGIWEKFADSGDPASTYHLGIMHLYGIGGAEFDQIRGFALIRAAAEAGYDKAQGYMGLTYEKGEGMFTLTNFEEALGWYEKAAKGGHCYSVRRLAHAHEKGGLGVAVNAYVGQSLRANQPRCFKTKT